MKFRDLFLAGHYLYGKLSNSIHNHVLDFSGKLVVDLYHWDDMPAAILQALTPLPTNIEP